MTASRARNLLVSLLGIGLAACTVSPGPRLSAPLGNATNALVSQGPDGRLTAALAQIVGNPARVIPNSLTSGNQVKVRPTGFVMPRLAPQTVGSIGADAGHDDVWGTSVAPATEVKTGVRALQQVVPDLQFAAESGETTLYAPTLSGPMTCSLESTTVYWHYSTMANTARSWGVWDHSQSDDKAWVVLEAMDDNWLATYSVSLPEHPLCYYTEIVNEGDTWSVQLFNFKKKAWETKFTQKAGAYKQPARDVVRVFHTGTKPVLPTIQSLELSVLKASWSLVTKDLGSEINPAFAMYPHQWIQPNSSWQVGGAAQ